MITPGGEPCTRPLGPHCAACFDDMQYYRALAALTRRRLKSLGLMQRVLVLSQYMAAMLVRAGLRAGERERVAAVCPPHHGQAHRRSGRLSFIGLPPGAP